MVKLLVGLLVLAGLLVAADRIGVHVAEHEVAKQAQVQADLGAPPDVTIDGVPFLTQAVSGVYDEVNVAVEGLERDGLRISEVKADLKGVHVPLSDAIDGSVSDIPVDRVEAHAFLSYHDINAFLAPKHVTVSAGPNGQLHLAATVSSAYSSYTAGGNANLQVTSSALLASVGGLSVKLPLSNLPFELSTTSARATSTGVIATATANKVDLRSSS